MNDELEKYLNMGDQPAAKKAEPEILPEKPAAVTESKPDAKSDVKPDAKPNDDVYYQEDYDLEN